MCAVSDERHTPRDESKLLVARLLRVAKAVIMVEDRRADEWTKYALLVPADQIMAVTREIANGRAVGDAATDQILALPRQPEAWRQSEPQSSWT
jgi:hypothetical protein